MRKRVQPWNCPLRWAIEFLLLLIIACAVCLIATAAIGQISIMEVIECMIHLINV